MCPGMNGDCNREMHVSGMFSEKKEIDPIKRGIEPINDPKWREFLGVPMRL